MLAADRLIPAAELAPGVMSAPAAFSALAHIVLLGLLLIPAEGPRLAGDAPPIEVEMIQTPAQTRGTPSPAPTPPEKPITEEPGPAAPSAPPPPAVNIGNGSEDSDPLTVTGDNIIPAAPDARYRNQPPGYPAEAARIGAEGTVQLMVHVSTQGLPLQVRIVRSSGNRSLDGAALRAVERWHFTPARSGGQTVAFDYLLNIRFALGDH